MFASQRPRLAWYGSSDQVNAFPKSVEGKVTHILLKDWPVADQLKAAFLVRAKRVASIGVELNNCLVLKTSLGESKRQAPRSSEQLNGCKHFSPQERK